MKKMKRSKKSAVMAGGLVAAIAIGGAFAYMSDSDNAVNKFSFTDDDGNQSVDIELNESEWEEQNGKNIKYGTPIAKNPTVKNISEAENAQDVYAFVSVILPAKNVAVQDKTGLLVDVDGQAYDADEIATKTPDGYIIDGAAADPAADLSGVKLIRTLASNVSTADIDNDSEDETEILGVYRPATDAEIAAWLSDDRDETTTVVEKIEGDFYVQLGFGDEIETEEIFFKLNSTAPLGQSTVAAPTAVTQAVLDAATNLEDENGDPITDGTIKDANGVVITVVDNKPVDANGEELALGNKYYIAKEGKIYKQYTVIASDTLIDTESDDATPHTFAQNDTYYKVVAGAETGYYTTVSEGQKILKDKVDFATGATNILGYKFMWGYQTNKTADDAAVRELYMLENLTTDGDISTADRDLIKQPVWTSKTGSNVFYGDSEGDGTEECGEVEDDPATDEVDEPQAEKDTIDYAEGNWIEITREISDTTIYVDADGRVYSAHVFYYSTPLSKGAETTPVFDAVELINVADNQLDENDDMNIYVQAYSIQKSAMEDVLDGEDADTQEGGVLIWDAMTNSQDQGAFDLFSVVKTETEDKADGKGDAGFHTYDKVD